MILPLQLGQGTALGCAPEAWFLPGESASRWLEDLARCGLGAADTRLFMVPKSAGNLAPAGLLVVPARTDSVTEHPAGIACRLMAGRVFVPVDAVLHPPVTDAELIALCPLPVSFFHPAFGLCGFEAESTLRVWDFIEPPTEHGDLWNFARPGAPALPELQTIMLAQPTSIDDVYGGADQEIGSEPPLDLPPAPDEPRADALTKSGMTLRRLFAEGVAGAMRQVPHTGTRQTWVNDIEDWANRQLRSVSDQLAGIRNKEMHRLLHLFETDPESALRHAIPMNAFAHRGLAPPGGRLGPRPANFDLSRLGGHAADFWNVPVDLQEVLRRRYREMADREMQLGRHRRAAYIYAELLGDLVSAAKVLKQGKHFREAVLLYDDYLKNPLEAARCLAEAGLLAEAIERYEQLERWLDVADLQERLGNMAAAETAVRRLVNERITQDDILGASNLVDERLHSTDEALDLLTRAWPASRQAAQCVGKAFELLARLGRHDAALAHLEQFARNPLPHPLDLRLVMALSGAARDFPHEQVRRHAADFSRVLIARTLAQPSLSELNASLSMKCLIRLAPQDRLLARDANRHLAKRRDSELRTRRVTPPPMPGHQPSVVERFELPRQMKWLRLRKEWHWFYAVGVTPKRLTLVRGDWQGELQSLSWDYPSEAVTEGLVCEPTGERGRAVALASSSGPAFAEKRFPVGDAFYGIECVAGTPGWLKPQHGPVAFGEDTVWTAHVAAGRGILSCHDKRGTLQRTVDMTDELLTGTEIKESARLCLTAVGNFVAIALGNRLVLTCNNGELARLELPGQIVGLHPTLPQTRAGVAIMLERGAAMHWLGLTECIELDRDIESPRGAFVPGGPLVLLSNSRLLLIHVDSRCVREITRVPVIGQRPIDVSATSSPGQFALLGENGEVTIYRVPR